MLRKWSQTKKNLRNLLLYKAVLATKSLNFINLWIKKTNIWITNIKNINRKRLKD